MGHCCGYRGTIEDPKNEKKSEKMDFSYLFRSAMSPGGGCPTFLSVYQPTGVYLSVSDGQYL